MLKLVEYSKITENQYMDYIKEWEDTGERVTPKSSARKGRSFKEMQYFWEYEGTEECRSQGLVPSTLYFLSDDKGKLYGASHFRHELNDDLLEYGGHIGYGVRPSERKKGYSTVMLQLMLEILGGRGYKRILITCDDDNIGSIRTIEKNGGVLENKVPNHQGIGRRYWIELLNSSNMRD